MTPEGESLRSSPRDSEAAARAPVGVGPRPEMHDIIGTPRRRVDGRAKVTGQTRFADDIMLPRMLHCKLLRSSIPHARVVRVDTARARASRRPPGAHRQGLPDPVRHPARQPGRARARRRSRALRRRSGRRRHRARRADGVEALDLIDVEYEPLRTFSDPDDSLAHPEPRIHDYGDAGNIHKAVSLRFGDVEQAFADADRVFEDTFFYPGQHAPADRAARGRRGEGSRRQAGALVEHADAALRASRAREGAGDAGGAHPRHRHAQRRRLRRQERPVQPRARRLQGRVDARSAR